MLWSDKNYAIPHKLFGVLAFCNSLCEYLQFCFNYDTFIIYLYWVIIRKTSPTVSAVVVAGFVDEIESLATISLSLFAGRPEDFVIFVFALQDRAFSPPLYLCIYKLARKTKDRKIKGG